MERQFHKNATSRTVAGRKWGLRLSVVANNISKYEYTE
jgi:hypothetical protein